MLFLCAAGLFDDGDQRTDHDGGEDDLQEALQADKGDDEGKDIGGAHHGGKALKVVTGVEEDRQRAHEHCRMADGGQCTGDGAALLAGEVIEAAVDVGGNQSQQDTGNHADDKGASGIDAEQGGAEGA